MSKVLASRRQSSEASEFVCAVCEVLIVFCAKNASLMYIIHYHLAILLLLLLLLALLPWFPFLFLPTGGSPSSSDAASTSMAVESSVVSVVPSVRSKVGPLIASLLRQGNWWFLLTAKPAVWRPSM